MPIGPDDSTGSLYFNRLFPLGIETLAEALDLIAKGNAPAIEQNEADASYEPPCRSEHAQIDFSRPAQDVYNLVRGCDPQPGAHARLGGRVFLFYDASLKPATTAAPGTITALDQNGMKIALKDGVLVVKKLRPTDGAKKVAPAELETEGLRAGAQFS